MAANFIQNASFPALPRAHCDVTDHWSIQAYLYLQSRQFLTLVKIYTWWPGKKQMLYTAFFLQIFFYAEIIQDPILQKNVLQISDFKVGLENILQKTFHDLTRHGRTDFRRILHTLTFQNRKTIQNAETPVRDILLQNIFACTSCTGSQSGINSVHYSIVTISDVTHIEFIFFPNMINYKCNTVHGAEYYEAPIGPMPYASNQHGD